MAISINNFNSLNKTISNNKVMKFKGCVAELVTKEDNSSYEVFKVNLQRDGSEYIVPIRLFVPKANAADYKVNVFMRSINQFAIAAMGKEEFTKAIVEAMGTKVLSNLDYAKLVAKFVNENTKIDQEVELFQVYCYNNGNGRYFNWTKNDGFTLNRAPVNESEIEFKGDKGEKIYRSTPEDISYTGTYYRFKGDNSIEFVESPAAAAFREVAQRRMDAIKNTLPTESTTTSEDNDVFPSDW